jgi:hypothetical protein
VLRRADVLVHVESFGAAERRYTRLSVSTKIPQYLWAARPILAYGPGEVASCQYVQSSASGVMVERLDLKPALQRLATDAGLRARLGRQAWLTARNRHDAKIIRERFRLVLAKAAQTRSAAGVQNRCHGAA